MRDFVEAGFDIAFQHPLIRAGSQIADLLNRVLRSAPWAKAVTARLKIRLKDRFEHQLQGSLDHPIPCGRNGPRIGPARPVRAWLWTRCWSLTASTLSPVSGSRSSWSAAVWGPRSSWSARGARPDG